MIKIIVIILPFLLICYLVFLAVMFIRSRQPIKKRFKIVFKNNATEIVSPEVATYIKEAINNGTKPLMTFTDSNNNVCLILNLLEIAYIIDVDYKVV